MIYDYWYAIKFWIYAKTQRRHTRKDPGDDFIGAYLRYLWS